MSMGSNAEVKEATVYGPTACLSGTTYQPGPGVISAGGVRGVFRIATSTTNVGVALPVVPVPGNESNKNTTPLRAQFLRIKNEDALASLEFAFGVGAAPTLIYARPSAFGTGDAAAGWRLDPLEWIDVIVPVDATHISFIQQTSAAASTVALYCSSGNIGDK
jgi:hypothetical protein